MVISSSSRTPPNLLLHRDASRHDFSFYDAKVIDSFPSRPVFSNWIVAPHATLQSPGTHCNSEEVTESGQVFTQIPLPRLNKQIPPRAEGNLPQSKALALGVQSFPGKAIRNSAHEPFPFLHARHSVFRLQAPRRPDYLLWLGGALRTAGLGSASSRQLRPACVPRARPRPNTVRLPKARPPVSLGYAPAQGSSAGSIQGPPAPGSEKTRRHRLRLWWGKRQAPSRLPPPGTLSLPSLHPPFLSSLPSRSSVFRLVPRLPVTPT